MFLLWCSDNSPNQTHSPSSRFPMCVLPASLYVIQNGVNITLETVTAAITQSFNRLSSDGIALRDLPSRGGGLVALVKLSMFKCAYPNASHQTVYF